MKNLAVIALFAILADQDVNAQSSFENLNFEDANPISAGNPDPYLVTAASALPDWSVYDTGVQQTEIIYNGISTGATAVTLVGTADAYVQPIDGNFSVILQGIVPGSSISISQTGLIPAGTQSLLFEAQPVLVPIGGPGPLELLVGTQVVPFAAVESEPGYTVYGANLSAWAGQTERISFLASGGTYSNWELDDISFSTNVVASPEPNIVALSAIGGLLFGARKWLARRS